MNAAQVEPAAAIARHCGELATALAIAREAIGKGGTADLETLADRLDEVLRALMERPGGERASHARALLALVEELEALGAVISEECRRCSRELAQGEANARAIAAYTRTSGH